jgi:hypothetical protein
MCALQLLVFAVVSAVLFTLTTMFDLSLVGFGLLVALIQWIIIYIQAVLSK